MIAQCKKYFIGGGREMVIEHQGGRRWDFLNFLLSILGTPYINRVLYLRSIGTGMTKQKVSFFTEITLYKCAPKERDDLWELQQEKII